MISHCELEGSFRFMLDYFGLDFRELGNVGVYDPETFMPTGKRTGIDLIGTPEFKEYCRRHVQMWRDERELI